MVAAYGYKAEWLCANGLPLDEEDCDGKPLFDVDKFPLPFRKLSVVVEKFPALFLLPEELLLDSRWELAFFLPPSLSLA